MKPSVVHGDLWYPNSAIDTRTGQSLVAGNIAHMFSTWPIQWSSLSPNEFREYIQGKTSVLHVSAHGNIDHHNSLLSSISIGEKISCPRYVRSPEQSKSPCLRRLSQRSRQSDHQQRGFGHGMPGLYRNAVEGPRCGSMLLMTLILP